jgi:hypothetical protein
VESKREWKSDDKPKTCCKVMTVDNKIKIVDKSCDGVSTTAVGLTLR